ncbi:MAG: Cof-type HAD-IIB family hydrolase [Coriobacteriales bacterium]|nr:Cof-type HAD-IIB family hydrolase [Coriobacteriales bacterium]
MAYKLLALDMDGTLLTSQKTVSAPTRDALERLAAAGTPIAYCSGRCFRELLDYPAQLPFVRYGVLASGAVVYDFNAQRTLDLHPLDAQVVEQTMAIADAEEHMTHVMSAAVSVVRPADIRRMDSFGMGVYQGMFEQICEKPDDLVQWVRMHPGEVVKLNFYHRDPAARDRNRERLAASGLPLTLANAEQTSVECSPLGVSKARGLQTLAEYLGCTLADVVAVGDSDNDLAALEAVGMPVAMGNATPAIKHVARLTVLDNDHDGIVDVVEQLFG